MARRQRLSTRAAAELMDGLLAQAIENDRLADLAMLVMETCRQRRIVAPSPATLERLCAELCRRGPTGASATRPAPWRRGAW